MQKKKAATKEKVLKPKKKVVRPKKKATKTKKIEINYLKKGKPLPKPQKSSDYSYYTFMNLLEFMTKTEIEKFCKWMYGQTVGVVDGESAYYSWDVERFVRLVRNGTPTYFD